MDFLTKNAPENGKMDAAREECVKMAHAFVTEMKERFPNMRYQNHVLLAMVEFVVKERSELVKETGEHLQELVSILKEL